MSSNKIKYPSNSNFCNTLDCWEFNISDGKNKINVNQEISKHIDQNNILTLKKPYQLKKLLNIKESKIKKNKDHFFSIENKKIKNWKILTIKDNTELIIDLNKNVVGKNEEINIIYFFNAMLSPLFHKLFKIQLEKLLQSKIFSKNATKIYIVCVADEKRKLTISKLLKKMKLDINKNFKIEFKNECTFEYEGIKKVYEVAKKSKNSYIIYFHGKGVSHLKTKLLFLRHPYEVLSFNRVIEKWERNIEWLSRAKNMKKLGLLNSDGWMLFNFWWAKSSYINKLEPPLKTNNRYYYEAWISHLPNKNNTSSGQNSNSLVSKVDKKNAYLKTIDTCINILYDIKLGKYNIGTTCYVGAKDMIYLGIHEFFYLPWYRLIKIVNILLRKQKL